MANYARTQIEAFGPPEGIDRFAARCGTPRSGDTVLTYLDTKHAPGLNQCQEWIEAHPDLGFAFRFSGAFGGSAFALSPPGDASQPLIYHANGEIESATWKGFGT